MTTKIVLIFHHRSQDENALVTSAAQEEIYRKHLSSISQMPLEEAEIVTKVLLFLVHTQEALYWPEIVEIITLDQWQKTTDIHKRLQTTQRAIEFSKTLFELNKESHLFAKYVRSSTPERTLRHVPDWERGHPYCYMSRICLSYLMLDRFRGGPPKTVEEASKLYKQYPLLIYASKYYSTYLAMNEQILEKGRTMIKEDHQIIDEVRHLFFSAKKRGFLHNALLAMTVGVRSEKEHYASEYHFDYCSGIEVSLFHEVVRTGSAIFLKRALKEYEQDECEQIINSFVKDKYDYDMRSPLLVACDNNHLSIVKRLINSGASLELPHADFGTPLQLAAARGYIQLVDMLVDHGANIDASAGTLGSVLTGSISSKDTETKMFNKILEAGADVHAVNNHLWQVSPLVAAVSQGMPDLVKRLLDMGLDIEAGAGEGRSSLMMACVNEKPKMVQLLLDKGADINSLAKRENRNESMLDLDLEEDREIMHILIEYGLTSFEDIFPSYVYETELRKALNKDKSLYDAMKEIADKKTIPPSTR